MASESLLWGWGGGGRGRRGEFDFESGPRRSEGCHTIKLSKFKKHEPRDGEVKKSSPRKEEGIAAAAAAAGPSRNATHAQLIL